MSEQIDVGTRVQHEANPSVRGTVTALTRDDFGNRRYVVDLDNGHRNVVYAACMLRQEVAA